MPAALLAVFLSLLVSAVLFGALTASAAPKKTKFGCTAEQVGAPSSAACLKQLEQDIIDEVAYPHQLVCDETGVHCCQSDGTRTFNCTRVSALQSIIRNLFQTPSNTLQLQQTPQLQQAPQTTR